MNKKITLYTWPHCPFCIRAKQLLDSLNLIYDDHNIYDDQAMKAQLVQATGQTTVPYIFFDDTLIGGYQELATLYQDGYFDTL